MTERPEMRVSELQALIIKTLGKRMGKPVSHERLLWDLQFTEKSKSISNKTWRTAIRNEVRAGRIYLEGGKIILGPRPTRSY